tara:strand:+ start:1733 stop:1909 length:177 start_codon:yes stop_codon:yes gene_type:complete
VFVREPGGALLLKPTVARMIIRGAGDIREYRGTTAEGAEIAVRPDSLVMSFLIDQRVA